MVINITINTAHSNRQASSRWWWYPQQTSTLSNHLTQLWDHTRNIIGTAILCTKAVDWLSQASPQNRAMYPVWWAYWTSRNSAIPQSNFQLSVDLNQSQVPNWSCSTKRKQLRIQVSAKQTSDSWFQESCCNSIRNIPQEWQKWPIWLLWRKQ